MSLDAVQSVDFTNELIDVIQKRMTSTEGGLAIDDILLPFARIISTLLKTSYQGDKDGMETEFLSDIYRLQRYIEIDCGFKHPTDTILQGDKD